MNKYDFDYNSSARDSIARTIVSIGVFAAAVGTSWLLLIGIDRLMGLMGIL